MTRIRDPIHGSIEIDERERVILDSPVLQRLRTVRQLGFSEMAFPGATHSRYAHALGACHLVGRVLDTIHGELSGLSPGDAARLRAAARVAMLLHDSGHAPFSHSSEQALPVRGSLSLPEWALSGAVDEQATHEDYTLLLLLDSELTAVMEREYGPLELPPQAIASLVAGTEAPGGPWFRVGGVDHAPLLRQLVSSELDADRMDYLLRDSFFTGVNYGQYDHDWLTSQLRAHVYDGRAELALRHRGIFAFEDFLLSRHHMFLSVYYHHTPVCFDRMLSAFLEEAPGEFTVPTEATGFLECDDLTLLVALRASSNRWAARIVKRRPFRVVAESNPYRADPRVGAAAAALREAGVQSFTTESLGMVSKYYGAPSGGDTIWVELPGGQGHVPLPDYTPLFRRYEQETRIERVYVDPDRVDDALAIVRRVRG